MRLITTNDLAKMAGVSKSHLQRLAATGCIPDSSRTAGGHWRIEDTEKVRQWATQRKKTRDRLSKALGKNFTKGPQRNFGAAIDTAGSHVARLMRFQRRLEDDHFFEWATHESLIGLLGDIRPAVEFYLRVNRTLLTCENEAAAAFAKNDLRRLFQITT